MMSNCALLLAFCQGQAGAYDYPFTNPYVATVINTPTEYAEPLPADIPVKTDTIRMFPDREVPGILWNLDELGYSYIRQKGAAPVVFLIAGTGSSFRSPKMQVMQKAFYQAGYNVISISSPTHPNFIVAASTSGVPGHLEEDAADLYKVMQAIWAKLSTKMNATGFYLAGYSLGAAESVFVAKLDEQEKAFNFSKVLLINPPVSLYNSVNLLDAMLDEHIPGGPDKLSLVYERLISSFAEAYSHGENVQFNDRFLYDTYKYHRPTNDEGLNLLIGLDFRISSENMAFTSDVLTKAGYVVPKDLELGRHDSVTDYAKILTRLSFRDYFEDLFLPYFQGKNPGLTEERMIAQMSLRSVEEYLRTSPKIGLIHNQDDIIMLPGEVDYLRDVFGSRARIFPHGGHCGNMAYPDNVAAMVGFFQQN
jgi:pimeloyl-ACP methyl ester carboxylesterase